MEHWPWWLLIFGIVGCLAGGMLSAPSFAILLLGASFVWSIGAILAKLSIAAWASKGGVMLVATQFGYATSVVMQAVLKAGRRDNQD